MYESACATHFEPGSRGCGVLGMGCQALCRVHTPRCRHGIVGFVDSALQLLPAAPSRFFVRVYLSRFGADSNAAVDVRVHSACGLNAATQTVLWLAGDILPRRLLLPVPPAHVLCGGLAIQMSHLRNCTAGTHREAAQRSSPPRTRLSLPPTFHVPGSVRRILFNATLRCVGSPHLPCAPANITLRPVGGSGFAAADFHMDNSACTCPLPLAHIHHCPCSIGVRHQGAFPRNFTIVVAARGLSDMAVDGRPFVVIHVVGTDSYKTQKHTESTNRWWWTDSPPPPPPPPLIEGDGENRNGVRTEEGEGEDGWEMNATALLQERGLLMEFIDDIADP